MGLAVAALVAPVRSQERFDTTSGLGRDHVANSLRCRIFVILTP
jgi:hypothetical protein